MWLLPPIHSKVLKSIIKEILNKIYDPSLANKLGPVCHGVNLTSTFVSQYLVSYYLPIHPKAQKAIMKEIHVQVKNTNL